MKRYNIISFSGGKDSTALILWAIENLGLHKINVVFFDTGWEHQFTYEYIDYIDNKLLKGKLIRLKSKKYDGFEDLCIKRKRVPSTNARYCTQELKIFPLKDYFKSLNGEIHSYNGIRAEESPRRAKMEMIIWDDDLNAYVYRPLLYWSADDVFAIHKKYNIEPNPLYKLGMLRVGCMPCIMLNHKEMINIIKNFPEIIENLKKLEKTAGRSFFPPNYIPNRFCTGGSNGKKFPWVDDVVKYLLKNENQIEMFEMPSCMSFYGLCE